MCGRETHRQTETDRQKETDRQTERGEERGVKKAHGISCMSCFFSLANSSFHSFYSSVLFLEVRGEAGEGGRGAYTRGIISCGLLSSCFSHL